MSNDKNHGALQPLHGSSSERAMLRSREHRPSSFGVLSGLIKQKISTIKQCVEIIDQVASEYKDPQVLEALGKVVKKMREELSPEDMPLDAYTKGDENDES